MPSGLSIRPIAIPATVSLIGTPPSINESIPAQTEAMDVDPFELIISETTLMAYGQSSSLGKTGLIALSANAP